MFDRIKRWRQKREDTKLLKYSMQVFRSVYPYASTETQACLAQTLWNLARAYGEQWDAKLGQFCYDEIHKIVMMNKGLSD